MEPLLAFWELCLVAVFRLLWRPDSPTPAGASSVVRLDLRHWVTVGVADISSEPLADVPLRTSGTEAAAPSAPASDVSLETLDGFAASSSPSDSEEVGWRLA